METRPVREGPSTQRVSGFRVCFFWAEGLGFGVSGRVFRVRVLIIIVQILGKYMIIRHLDP